MPAASTVCSGVRPGQDVRIVYSIRTPAKAQEERIPLVLTAEKDDHGWKSLQLHKVAMCQIDSKDFVIIALKNASFN